MTAPRLAMLWCGVAWLCPPFAASPAGAQMSASGSSPPRHAAVERFRDSLAAIGDTGALRSLRHQRSELSRRAPRDPARVLQLGFIDLRLAELGADPDFSDAISTFRKAADLPDAAAYALYGGALARMGRSRWEARNPRNLGSRVGLKSLEKAGRELQAAVAADPTLVPAAAALADVVGLLRDTTFASEAVTTLREAAAALGPPVPPVPELLLALGRVERRAGLPGAAMRTFRDYLEIGGPRAIGLLELARTALALGDSGEAAYYEGAALPDSTVVAGYRADLALIAPDSVLAAFDSRSGAARTHFLRRFWSARDHADLRRNGERLQEHYRRLLYAERHFPLTISRRFYGRHDAYRSGNMELDDRGIIYVRHGEPAARLRPFVFGLMPNESWQYRRAGGDLLFHFSGGYDESGGGDLYDYRLVESVLDLRGASDAPVDQLLLSREPLSPMYARMLHWGRFGAARQRARERGIGRTSIEYGTTTDSYELQFARRLGVAADLVAVGQSDSGGLVHFVFAVAEGGPKYPVRVRLAVLDALDQMVASTDTTILFNPALPLAKGQYLLGRVELPVLPGRWRWRAAVQHGDSVGVVFPASDVTVTGHPNGMLSLSDIALASREAALRWTTGATDTVFLSPFRVFPTSSDVEVYYRVLGGVSGADYRHQITVLRWNENRPAAPQRPVFALSFDERAADTVIHARRTLRLDRLPTGGYAIEVRVTGPDGRSATRRRTLVMVRP